MAVILHGIKARVARGQASSAEAKVYAAMVEPIFGLALQISQEEESDATVKSKL